jgi:hypothetical protein
MWMLYRVGRMPGIDGRLLMQDASGSSPRGWRVAIVLTAILLVATAAYARSGWFYVYPLNTRVLWLVLFSLPTTLGFWIGRHEFGLIAQAAPGKAAPQVAALLIGLTPFFMYTVFLAILGSLSGVIGGVQGLLILGICLSYGFLLRQFRQNDWVTGLCQAVLLYWLILPQGVLFG